MLQFVIGVGTRSIDGAALEHALRHIFEADTFEVNPIEELEYQRSSVARIQQRAIHFAERMQHLTEAKMYIGIASGIANFKTKLERGPVRYDILTNLLVESDGKKQTWLLNYHEACWQARNRKIWLKSDEESLSRVIFLVQGFCKELAKSKS